MSTDSSSAFAHSMLLALASYGFCVVSGVLGSPVYILVAFVMIDSYRNKRGLLKSRSNQKIELADDLHLDVAAWIEQLDCYSENDQNEEEEDNDDSDEVTQVYSDSVDSPGDRHNHLTVDKVPVGLGETIRKLSNELIVPMEKELAEAESVGRIDGLKAQDVVDFVDSIRYLVRIDGGGVSISPEQVKMIRSSVFAVTDLAFTSSTDATKASAFCMTKLPVLLCHIQVIQQHACEQTDFSIDNDNDTFMDLAIASYTISNSLSRAVALITSSTVSAGSISQELDMDDFFSHHLHYFWVREQICLVLAYILGNKIQDAESQLLQLIHQVAEQEKRDSQQIASSNSYSDTNNEASIDAVNSIQHNVVAYAPPLPSNEPTTIPTRSIATPTFTTTSTALTTSSSRPENELPKTYLLYTSSIDTFLPTSSETPQIRTAIAQMSAAGLYPGDFFILLSSWHDENNGAVSGSNTRQRPRSNFIPQQQQQQKFRRQHIQNAGELLVEKKPQFRSWFDRVSFVKLIDIVEEPLSSLSNDNSNSNTDNSNNNSTMTIEVLQEKDTVGFEFVSGMDGNVSRMVLENRVKDSLRFGAVRVEQDVVKAFFSE
ncbi:hypothetical protein BDR26DRAFT_864236 [Obelidium mucronatum]|nr:hypothetical protein BDR26DRAFT_864236 [Obelidium mucronatum]